MRTDVRPLGADALAHVKRIGSLVVRVCLVFSDFPRVSGRTHHQSIPATQTGS